VRGIGKKNAGGGQWVRGKSFDTCCPLGPALVTADEIRDPNSLRISSIINGTVMQQSNTADMIFNCAQIISWVSTDTTLLPGTVILTGTPEGVGSSRNPPAWLTPRDQVAIEIETLGRLENHVVGPVRPRL